MSSHSDGERMLNQSCDLPALAGIYPRSQVVWACSQVEAEKDRCVDPTDRGRAAKFQMQSRIIAAVVAFSDSKIGDAGQVFGLDYRTAFNRRRWFIDDCPREYQVEYLTRVREKLIEAGNKAAG